jgi:outer membrane protein assembly factor BamE (lipoprotein component of BamABCDE complex)
MSIRKLGLLGFIMLLSACSSDVFLVHNGNMPSNDKVNQVAKGQTRAEVEQILGAPSAVTSFDANTWIYMSSTLKKVAFFEPEETKRDVLAITFNDKGVVSAIKTYNKEDGKNIAIDKTETPTVGHNIGFFRKYFGGVGAYMPIAPTDSGDKL